MAISSEQMKTVKSVVGALCTVGTILVVAGATLLWGAGGGFLSAGLIAGGVGAYGLFLIITET